MSSKQQRDSNGNDLSRVLSRLATPRMLILLMLLVVSLTYIGTLRFDFVSDDETQITGNRFLQSWSYVPRFFTGHAWSHIRPESQGNYYRPIALLWLFVNHLLFGLNPSWWHLTTVLLNVGATLAVYFLVQRLMNDRLIAGVAALIFGLHPVHIEAVAWVSGFTEPLLTIFIILSLISYLKSKPLAAESTVSQKRGVMWLAISLALYAAALLTKETGIILPALVFGYEWLFNRKPFVGRIKSAFARTAPYLALTVVYLVVRSVVLAGLSHSLRAVPLSTMILTWPSLLWLYARHLIWPFGLSAFYDTPYVTSPGFSNVVLPALGLALAGAGIWYAAKRATEVNRRAIIFAVALLVLPILPLLNLSVLIEDELVHDRYLYIPSIGFAIILAIGVSKVSQGSAMLFGQPALRAILVLALTCALGFATSFQESYWANDLVLYHHSVTCAPNNKAAETNFANELSKRGYYDDAIEHYQALLERDPNYWAAAYDLGCNYYLLGRYAEAESYLSRGIMLRPMEPKQFVTLAVTLQEANRLQDAERAARRAIEIRPEGYGFHYELADILRAQGKLSEAIDEFRAELAFNPEHTAAYEQIAEIEKQRSSSNVPGAAPTATPPAAGKTQDR